MQQQATEWRDKLREVLQDTQQCKQEHTSLKHEMSQYKKDSLTWGITTALPAIWKGSDKLKSPSVRECNEQELELLLSALRVALIHQEFSHALQSTPAAAATPRPAPTVTKSSTYSISNTSIG
eukprot:TRINITY_DN5746_c0_g1_i1.p1 TRINITY_DN5746_c0_g1~~TRINITY_DN5746_c0_g1_i1.p1  ORF type:complete len:123 (+),score=45.72 TRINITY_DN5746_c0_g1_i1:616-984(+)